MKEFKGTKGVWSVAGDIVIAEEETTISFVAGSIDDEHDASLIAAAPNLLLCLQQIVSSAYRIGLVSDDDSGLSLEVSKAEFYIAKALGETK